MHKTIAIVNKMEIQTYILTFQSNKECPKIIYGKT